MASKKKKEERKDVVFRITESDAIEIQAALCYTSFELQTSTKGMHRCAGGLTEETKKELLYDIKSGILCLVVWRIGTEQGWDNVLNCDLVPIPYVKRHARNVQHFAIENGLDVHMATFNYAF